MSPDTLFSDYIRTYLRLYQSDARRATVEQYEVSARSFVRLVGDLPVGRITHEHVHAYRTQCPGRPATVNKHCRQLNAMLRRLGPAGPGNRGGLGVLATVPWFEPPRVSLDQAYLPSTAELSRFVLNARLDMAYFAVLAATTGSRNTALRLMPLGAIRCDEQLLCLPSATDKRRQARVKPLPAVTVEWARLVDQTWPASRQGFLQAWRAEAARVGAPRLRPHGLKRWWGDQLIAAGASPWCVKYALDHAQSDVTGLHYLQPQRELARVIEKMTFPDAFRDRLALEGLVEPDPVVSPAPPAAIVQPPTVVEGPTDANAAGDGNFEYVVGY